MAPPLDITSGTTTMPWRLFNLEAASFTSPINLFTIVLSLPDTLKPANVSFKLFNNLKASSIYVELNVFPSSIFSTSPLILSNADCNSFLSTAEDKPSTSLLIVPISPRRSLGTSALL